jgi:hypothetical protein
MLRRTTFAGLFLALVWAAPGQAANQAAQDDRPLPNNIGPQVAARAAPAASLPFQSSPEAGLFEGVGPGLAISRQTFQEQDGSATVRSGLVRSWAVTDGISAGLGLFSVTHDDQKEPEFKRNWSAKNVGPRNRRVAAVGLNLSF